MKSNNSKNITEIEVTVPRRVLRVIRLIAKKRGCSEGAIQLEALREYLKQHQVPAASNFGGMSPA